MGKYSDVEELLMVEVRQFPALWNTTDHNYKNKVVKENVWTAVADTVNTAAGKIFSGTVHKL